MRMSWISKRRTSREEDMAYSLLGLFNVNMPLLYGEGRKAFVRLQMEIIKNSDDESVFAWETNTEDNRPMGMLADWPTAFETSADIISRPTTYQERIPYAMTNKGLEFYVPGSSLQPGIAHGMFTGKDKEEITLNCWRHKQRQQIGGHGKSSSGTQTKNQRGDVLTIHVHKTGRDSSWKRANCQRLGTSKKFKISTDILGRSVPQNMARIYVVQDGIGAANSQSFN